MKYLNYLDFLQTGRQKYFESLIALNSYSSQKVCGERGQGDSTSIDILKFLSPRSFIEKYIFPYGLHYVFELGYGAKTKPTLRLLNMDQRIMVCFGKIFIEVFEDERFFYKNVLKSITS